MNTIFLMLVAFLFVLAIFDLTVGVSNDAVNFLNSAIGAKVATFRTIIIVAAIGIFIGAAMSNGMMEIARNGILKPSLFSFKEVLVIFIAVMVSDIILLDIFNSLGMPTSTTVSMVFELLGGTFALAIIKIVQSPEENLTLSSLMNTEKALSVIMAIFVSVAIAFFFGTLIQFLSRLLFSFAYKEKLKWKIGVFGGIAATAILYFMLIKGISGSPLINKDVMNFINTHTWQIIGGVFIACTIIMQILYLCKVNVLKILVLLGTFALAMAFAGNDLVNFIGVPLAGFASYTDFVTNGGTDASTWMMTALDSPAKTPMIFLIGAGIIMVISLATSKKAYNVVKTSVDLAKQGQGDEVFGSAKVARVLVRTFSGAAKTISDMIPEKLKAGIDERFDIEKSQLTDGAAFDEIRATVNLVVASLLIALGTSLKLPLSTTYVTFMVAMGSSLADKAWGRESAVFRITGVLSVIGGWFITAGAAFTMCLILSVIMYIGGYTLIIIIVAFAIYMLIKNNINFNKRKKIETGDLLFTQIMECEDSKETLTLIVKHINSGLSNFLIFSDSTYSTITNGFFNEDLTLLEKAGNKIRKYRSELKTTRRKEIMGLRKISPEIAMGKNTWFHLAINSCEDILYGYRRICDTCMEHIDNNLEPLSKEKIMEFTPLRDSLLFMIKRINDIISSSSYTEATIVSKQCDELEECLSKARKEQTERIQATKDNIAISYVYLNMIQESQQIIISLRHLLRAARHLNEK